VATGRSCYPVFSVSVGPARRFTLSSPPPAPTSPISSRKTTSRHEPDVRPTGPAPALPEQTASSPGVQTGQQWPL